MTVFLSCHREHLLSHSCSIKTMKLSIHEHRSGYSWLFGFNGSEETHRKWCQTKRGRCALPTFCLRAFYDVILSSFVCLHLRILKFGNSRKTLSKNSHKCFPCCCHFNFALTADTYLDYHSWACHHSCAYSAPTFKSMHIFELGGALSDGT